MIHFSIIRPSSQPSRHRIAVTLLAILATSLTPASSVLAAGLAVLPAPESAISSPLIIRAINPGYEVDGQANVGEFIELAKNSDQSSVSLAGFSLNYTNTSGKRSNIIEFPEDSQLTGEALLFRYAKTPVLDEANWTYTTTLAMEAGPLELLYRGEVVDSVCWRGKDCLTKFDKEHPTSIVKEPTTNTYSHQTSYLPSYRPTASVYRGTAPTIDGKPPATDSTPVASSDDAAVASPQCRGLIFNELLSYYDSDKSEQFIEFFNPTDETIVLDGCQLRYKKKLYPLTGLISAGDYVVRNPTDFTLTKNPTTSNLLELIDVNGDIVDQLEYLHGQKKSTSYALFGYTTKGTGEWRITYTPTPGSTNNFQEYRSCPAGKVINEITGNCVKAATLKTADLACPAGKYRNPETGRCKKIESDEPKTCADGYELNPETNRCRKVKTNTGAEFALVPLTGEARSTFVALGAIILLALLGLGGIIFQFRHELRNFLRKLRGKPKLPVPPRSSSPLQKALVKASTCLRLRLQPVRRHFRHLRQKFRRHPKP